MAPTCSVPASTRCAATQVIRTPSPLMTNIIDGIMKVMTRFVKSCVRIRSVLASSKRSSSVFSLPNARTTISPVRISLETRFSRSTSFCMLLNFGIASTTSVRMMPTITAIPSRITQLMLAWD